MGVGQRGHRQLWPSRALVPRQAQHRGPATPNTAHTLQSCTLCLQSPHRLTPQGHRRQAKAPSMGEEQSGFKFCKEAPARQLSW